MMPKVIGGELFYKVTGGFDLGSPGAGQRIEFSRSARSSNPAEREAWRRRGKAPIA